MMMHPGQRRRVAALGALSVLLAACSGDGGTGPNGATTVAAASPTVQTSATRTAVAQPPSVRVTNRDGEPVAGVAVSFRVTAGGGTLSYNAATTDAMGFATSGGWLLGATAGENTVTATVSGLSPVRFTANAQARAPAALVPLSATSQPGAPGTPVVAPPIVRVSDQTGAPMSGVTVTFTVTTGGGTVGNPTATTNTAGEAAAGSWTLGPAQGQNVVTATVPGVPPVTFTATSDPCQAPTWYTRLATITAALTTSDCRLSSGHYLDFYAINLAGPISFRMSSSEVDTWLELYDEYGDLVALNDDADGSNSEVNLFPLSGTYYLAASTFDPDELGSYQLSSSNFSQAVDCNEYWMVPGITLEASVASTDCERDGYYSDVYFVVLRPGQQVNLYMQSQAFNSLLELYDAVSGELVARNDNDGDISPHAHIVYRAWQLSIFAINATTFDAGATGAYQLSLHTLDGDRPAALRSGELRAGLLDAANAAARARTGERKASPAVRGSVSRELLHPAPWPRAKRTGTR